MALAVQPECNQTARKRMAQNGMGEGGIREKASSRLPRSILWDGLGRASSG